MGRVKVNGLYALNFYGGKKQIIGQAWKKVDPSIHSFFPFLSYDLPFGHLSWVHACHIGTLHLHKALVGGRRKRPPFLLFAKASIETTREQQTLHVRSLPLKWKSQNNGIFGIRSSPFLMILRKCPHPLWETSLSISYC